MPTPTFSTLAPMSMLITRLLPAQTRTEASATARPSAPVNSTIFAGSTEEEDGNEWSESEAPPKEEHCGHKRPSAGEDGRELTLEGYCKIWGVHPSELDPDEPGPSTKRQSRVPPLADDEVAKFDCGICLETLPILDLFHGMQCDHKFCAQCMATYIEGRIRDGGVSILCPSCKIVVERIMGCDTMHCRCGSLFCYKCGRPMAPMEAELDEGAELCQCRHNVFRLRVPRPQPGAHQTNLNLN
ncbi:unnamed protein product [Miscanthus lutarioriparius]|uniref:RING-type domain-containing protein n=1 Tax=Miscanthus lutarioriparius TaxID=422564 RepID=A0A811N6T0_9POAL|nr:unnamed protein product [Miscanthus lutarioriparius]